MEKKVEGSSEGVVVGNVVDVRTPMTLLSVDYPTEGLNDMARKINQIIERLN